MSFDADIESYLRARATDIHLPPGDLGAVTRAARHRRRRRAAARTGVAAALLAGGALIVVDRPRGTDPAEQAGEGEVAQAVSPLEWTLVGSQAGLGWSQQPVVADGAVYSLSTAPGQTDSSGPRRLYRSADGAEGTDWEEVALPEGLYPSSLAATDGTLYAVGTSAAGGEVVGVTVATSTDGGGDWSAADVPLDLAALGEGFPGKVWTNGTSVATAGGTTVVAVTVEGQVDPTLLVPDDATSGVWMPDVGGLVRFPDCMTDETQMTPEQAAALEDIAAREAGEAADAAVPTMPPSSTVPGAAGSGGDDEACQPERRSWADAGLTADQARLAEGETHLFIATDGGELEPAGVVASLRADLLVADDGWWLIGATRRAAADPAEFSSIDDLIAWHSTDGTAWDPTPLGSGQWAWATGVVQGRPVVVALASGVPAATWSHRIEADGSVTSTDVTAALGLSGGSFGAAVGPLGVALVMPADGGLSGDAIVAHSFDGAAFSREALPPADAATRRTVAGVTVSPDAVKVRLNLRDASDLMGEGPAEQQVFVGVPA